MEKIYDLKLEPEEGMVDSLDPEGETNPIIEKAMTGNITQDTGVAF